MPQLFRWFIPVTALLAGIAGITAAWLAVAILSDSNCSWMALLAAADTALMLRLTRAPQGGTRMALSVLATAFAIASAYWFIAAAHIGGQMGLQPFESMQRMGPVFAWTLTKFSLHPQDWLWLLASLPLAAVMTGKGKA